MVSDTICVSYTTTLSNCVRGRTPPMVDLTLWSPCKWAFEFFDGEVRGKVPDVDYKIVLKHKKRNFPKGVFLLV